MMKEKILKQMMKDARNTRKGITRIYLLRINANNLLTSKRKNKLTLDDIEFVNRGGYITCGTSQFKNQAENEFKFVVRHDSFLSYENLIKLIKRYANEFIMSKV